ncbi:MAG: amino acid ABC transporter ATP-binding protein [Bacilli bacterium]|nr:amino acid ABC transporter ATP-binding protein [Bacilli bacterium]
MSYLEIKNIAKRFEDNKVVLKDFSFSLEKGETISLIGNSGSGKTTFLRILNFLLPMDSGSIVLEGKELCNGSSLSYQEKQKLNSNFGLVFQNMNLFPQYTALDNILLPLKSKLKKEAKEQAKEEKKKWKLIYQERLDQEMTSLKELASTFLLTEKLNHYPNQLSGGEAQRVAILRALVLKPKILCFDEPTSALDPKLKQEVANTILHLKKVGTTMIVVTHEMELALAVSDKVIYLEKGSIIEVGDKSILLTPKSDKLKAFLSLRSTDDESKEEKRRAF